MNTVAKINLKLKNNQVLVRKNLLFILIFPYNVKTHEYKEFGAAAWSFIYIFNAQLSWYEYLLCFEAIRDLPNLLHYIICKLNR